MSAPRKQALAGLLVPFGLFAALLLAYTIYWTLTARALSAALDGWAQAERAAGAEIGWADAKVEGFPYRLQMQILEPTYVDLARSGWGWQAARVTLTAMPYNTRHVIANFNGAHRLVSPSGEVFSGEIGGGAASASFRSGRLNRADLVIEDARLQGTEDAAIVLKGFQIHASPMPETPADMRLWIEAGEILQPFGWPAPLGGTNGLVEAGTGLTGLQAAIALTEGLSASVVGSPRPVAAWQEAGGRIIIARMEASAGLFSPALKGEFKLDENRQISGVAEVRLNAAEALWESLREAGQTTTPAGLLAGLARDLGPNAFLPILIQESRIVSPPLIDPVPGQSEGPLAGGEPG